MNYPEEKIEKIFNNLTQSNINFALYRLPWRDECHLVLQTSGGIEKLSSLTELNSRKGFVMAPFDISGELPILLIRPDITAFGWEEIEKSILQNINIETIEKDKKENTLSGIEDEGITLKEYENKFNTFITELNHGDIKKLVLSRFVSKKLNETFSPFKAFINACNEYPRMMIYMCHTSYSGTWMGSTPEIIVNGHEDKWHTVALAGTMKIDSDIAENEWSNKNRDEQKYVSDYIREIIKSINSKANIDEKGPYSARAGELIHLKTDFFFTLKDNVHIGNILDKLHPTPAVCGLPKDKALKFIEENEGYNRKYYSGIVGWIDSNKETELYINLRCMQIKENRAILHAGGGIMTSSTMDQEWEETKQKLETMGKIILETNNKN